LPANRAPGIVAIQNIWVPVWIGIWSAVAGRDPRLQAGADLGRARREMAAVNTEPYRRIFESRGPALEPYRRIAESGGPAAGKIDGINHLVLVCKDMERSVRFYRDLLGLRLVATQPTPRAEYERQYFFELGNGELLSLYQVANAAAATETAIVPKMWPESVLGPPAHPEKMDHLAFDVPTNEDVAWFKAHLESSGVAVSAIARRPLGRLALCDSIYFYDPDSTPLEIASSERNNPAWNGVDRTQWFRETDPVPSALERE
jgi:catechol 2,3-dioxygenase-like lactoylglutathione lyase family enzyme